MTLDSTQAFQEEEYSIPYHYQDLLAQGYKPLRLLEYTSKLQVVKDMLKPFRNQRVLDAGCGDGRFCFELKNENIKLVGVDYSERALSFARAFCHGSDVEFFCQDLRDLELPYRFDAITFLDALEHIPPSDIPVMLYKLSEHLADDGRLLVTVPSLNTRLQKKHYQHFDEASLTETMKPYFTPVAIQGFFVKRRRIVVKQFQNVIGNLFPLLGKVGLYRPLHDWAVRYFVERASLGKPGECLDLIAVFEKRPLPAA